MGLGVVMKIYINFVEDFHNKPQINTTKNINIHEEEKRERKKERKKNEKKKQQAVAGP